MKKLFINLTNGIEYLKGEDIPDDVLFVRIQSTQCEQKQWEHMIMDLDYNFLLHLALGTECTVVDYGSRSTNGISRAVSHGLPLIEYVLNRLWFDRETKPMVKGFNVQIYFSHVYHDLMNIRSLKSKLSYFKKLLNTDSLHLDYKSEKTNLDSKYDEYAKMLANWHDEQILVENFEKEINDEWYSSHQDRCG